MKPFSQDGFTQVNNWIIDTLMQSVNGNEFKTLICIMRYTVGWHQAHEIVSYSQIRDMTGIKSNTTVSNCLQTLLDKQYIIRQCVGHHSEFETPIFVYAINRDYEVEDLEIEHLSSSKNGQVPSPFSGQSERKKEKDNYIYHQFLEILSLAFGTKAQYENVFAQCKLVSYENGVLTIALRNEYALDLVTNHTGTVKTINRAIEQVENLNEVRFLSQD